MEDVADLKWETVTREELRAAVNDAHEVRVWANIGRGPQGDSAPHTANAYGAYFKVAKQAMFEAMKSWPREATFVVAKRRAQLYVAAFER